MRRRLPLPPKTISAKSLLCNDIVGATHFKVESTSNVPPLFLYHLYYATYALDPLGLRMLHLLIYNALFLDQQTIKSTQSRTWCCEHIESLIIEKPLLTSKSGAAINLRDIQDLCWARCCIHDLHYTQISYPQCRQTQWETSNTLQTTQIPGHLLRRE